MDLELKYHYEFDTFEEYTAYLEGYLQAVYMWSVWKDGKMWIGSPEVPYSEIRKEVERTRLIAEKSRE